MAIFSQTWLVPFFYLAIMLGIYLFAPQDKRADVQKRMRTEPNLYLICDIVLVFLAIPATLDWRHRWIDYLTWLTLVITLLISVPSALKDSTPAEPDEPPPL